MAVTLERPTRGGFATWFTQRPLWHLVAIAAAVNALLFGVAGMPYLRLTASYMADPFHPMDVETVEPASPLMWIVAHWLGANGTSALFALNLAILIVVLLASAYLLARWISDMAGRLFVAAWFMSPLANVQLTWLGKPDHLTMFGAVLLVGTPGACFAGGALLGFDHFEQGAVIVGGTLLVRLAYGTESRRWVAYMFGGFIAGRALWMLYAISADYQASSSRLSYVADEGVGSFVSTWSGNIPTLLFSVFAVLWLPVAVMFRDSTRRQRWALGVAFGVATAATLLTIDLTRVYALVTLPILLGCVTWFARADRSTVLRALPWLLLVAVVVPRVVLWGDELYVSSWQRFG